MAEKSKRFDFIVTFSVAPFLSMKERAMHDKVNEIPGTHASPFLINHVIGPGAYVG
jgi:hypothetical protein